MAEYENGAYTGRELFCKITHILQGVYGIPEGWAVLSIKPNKFAICRKNSKVRKGR